LFLYIYSLDPLTLTPTLTLTLVRMETKAEDSPSNTTKSMTAVRLTAYEQTLLNALRMEPRSLDMWIKLGNPNKYHRDITAMLLHTLDVFNALEVEYWADYGTLLGALRHRGVIPVTLTLTLTLTTTLTLNLP
jgi:hypothetical protein